MDPIAWLDALSTAIVQRAEQTAGPRVDLRVRAKGQYLALRTVRLCLQWGDFSLAQAEIDELWQQHLRQ